MDPAPMTGGPEAYRTLLEQGLALDVVTANRAVIPSPIATPSPPACPMCPTPAEARQGGEFKIHIGPAPKQGTAISSQVWLP